MYREQIKVLDCTIRDGGLINNHYFTDEFVREVYKALTAAGIDYMEMGYRSSRKYAPAGDFGAWKYCDDDKIMQTPAHSSTCWIPRYSLIIINNYFLSNSLSSC